MATRRIGRLLTWVGGFFVLWGPLLTLALLGVGYVLDCLNSVTDPGTGLVYEMEGRKGPVVLRAKSYTFGLLTGILIARDVTVTSPGENEVARASEVDINLPDYFGAGPRLIAARIKGLEGTIIRDESGEFTILDLLPPEREQPSEQSYRIDIDDAVIHVIDRAAPEVWTRTLRLPSTKVDGIGDRWRASSEVFEVGGGSAKVAIRSEPATEIAIQGRFADFDIAPWLGPLQSSKQAEKWDLVRDLSAKTLVVNGPLSLRLPREGKAEIDGDVIAEGRGVRHREVYAETAKLEASFDTSQFTGWVDLERSGAQAHFTGRIAWEPAVNIDGQMELELADPSLVPKDFRAQIPKDVSFRSGRYAGFVFYDEKQGLTLHGRANAAAAVWKEYRLEQPVVDFHMDPNQVAVRNAAALYEGIKLQGSGDFDLKAKTLTAFASSPPVRIETFRKRTGLDRISGVVTLEALASGSLDNPDVELRARGLASAEIEKGKSTDVGPFHALAHYRDSLVRIDRFAIAGPSGLATATGTYNIDTRQIDMDAVATGIDLAKLHSKLNGTAAGTFQVTGTPDAFTAKGPVEVYGLEVNEQPVPLVAAEIEVTPDQLLAHDVRATRGAARLRGTASWTFESDALHGEFAAESIQLHDFMAEGNEGSLDLSEGSLSGTLSRPVISGTVSGSDLVLQGVIIDAGTGSVRIEDSKVELLSSKFTAGKGTLSASATYDLDSRNGQVSGTAEGLPIERIQPLLPPDTGIEGVLDGKFTATLADARLGRFEADGGVEGFSVNRAFLGNGFYTLNATGNTWGGTLEIGQPERFIQVPEFTYYKDRDELEADFVAYGLPVRDIYFAARPYFNPEPGKSEPRVELPRNLRDILDRLQGSLDLSAHISGNIGDPNLRVESLLVRNTTVDGEATGQIEAKATRLDRLWTISQLQWSGGPGIFDVKGTIRENGPLSLDGDFKNFDTQWLQRFIPSFASITGEADLIFSVTGETKNPQIEASLTGSLFRDPLLPQKLDAIKDVEKRLAAEQEAKDKELKLNIYPILVSEGQIELTGQFGYRGFSGDLKGNVPFRYPFTFPNDEQMELSLHVPERQLDDLKPLVERLDVNRTDGKVWADVKLAGTFEEAAVSGGVNLQAATLAFLDVDTVFKDVTGTTGLQGESLRLDLYAKPDKGGSLSANARLSLSDLSEALRSSAENLLNSRIEGAVNFKQAHFAEKNLPLDPDAESSLSTEFIADGGIRVSGPLRRPVISTFTPLALHKVSGDIPTLIPAGTGATEAYIQPRFNLHYVLATRDEPATLKAAASELRLWGTGSVTGPLDQLEANANLRVRSGHIRLPNSRINIQEGGTVRLRYDGSGFDPELRLDVDIEGRTTLSTIKYGTLIERYDIYLELKGNLLNAEQQTITARSDPPDLPQERIMNLLGQVELVERISSNLIGGQHRRQLEQALTGLALPYVFDPITENLARQLGLEYLSLDYGPLGQTTITAARGIGKGFMLQGSREVSVPIDRVPDYELRLTYRPPRRIRQLRSVLFSVGLDQDRPWKISVEYGGRLPISGSRNPTDRIYIGEEPRDKPRPPQP